VLVFSHRAKPDQKMSLRMGDRVDRVHAWVLKYLKQHLSMSEAQRIWTLGQKIPSLPERTLFYTQACVEVEQQLEGKLPSSLHSLATYKFPPVGIREFICSPFYLNKAQEIYPLVLAAAEELNNGLYVEAILTGGIGSGKTTLALYTTAYQLYLLSCMRAPHRMFRLDPSSEILFIFQSITKNLAKGVDYQRFRSMIEGSPYFTQYFPFNRDLEAKMIFEGRIEVVPVSGAETAAIGQNVMGGVIDELNYMAIVEKSKASVDHGTYDQAISIYNSISRRRKSRFMENGKLPGILCLVSSKRYPGQFTDQKMAEAQNDPSIFVYDKRVWDIKPEGFGQQGWFHVFTGDMTRKPRILQPDEQVQDEDRIDHILAVPNEFRVEFEKDVINALREIGGCSTLARHPFFMEVDRVHAAFKKEQRSVFSQTPVDFVMTRLTLVKSAFYQPDLPRFAHVDLGLTGDSAGVAVGTVTGFMNISADQKSPVYMPEVYIDGVLEVQPPRNSEIILGKIRDVLLALIKMGLNIRWVTFDQFQSSDSQQILRQRGLITGPQSMDEVPCRAYDFTKAAIYEGRLRMPLHPHLQREMLMLEKDTKTGKVDHPPGLSKDCADALAGVAYGLTMRREIWGLHRIPIVTLVADIMAKKDALKHAPTQPSQSTFEGERNLVEQVRERRGLKHGVQ
jgi:hypothetical protein